MIEKTKNSFTLETNSFVDAGEGVIRFTNGLVITDDSVMKSGHSYDIPSMSLSDWNSLITLDHEGTIESIVGKAFGLRKAENAVLIDGVRLAINENPKAKFLYNLLKGGFLPDVSVETYDGTTDETGRRVGAKLVGLSFVVVGNNDNAALIKNSLEQAGLVKELAEQSILGTDKPEENKEEEIIMAEETKVVETPVEEEKAPESQDNSAILTAINSLGDALKGVTSKVEAMEQNAFSKNATEPEFEPTNNSVQAPTILKSNFSGLTPNEIANKQIQAAWGSYKDKSPEAHKQLMDLNKFNLERLQKAGIATNSMTIESMGDFVISPELHTEIIGHRSDFRPFLDLVSYRDTLSLEFAALRRNGGIDMQIVDMCEDDEDSSGNIKPVSEYDAEPIVSRLWETAAVTPVCTAATRFLAVDVLGDIASEYRLSYDRKLAQLVIARLQQAVNVTGNTVLYDTDSDSDKLKSVMDLLCAMQENVMDGIIVLNQCSYAEILKAAVGAGIAGPLASVFTSGSLPTIAGIRFLVVPNELLPSLGTNETRVFQVGNQTTGVGESVVINQAMFYFKPSTFNGRTSGGLNYRFSTEAPYQKANGAWRSSFQRDELLIRGYFFSGGLVMDDSEVVGVGTTILS